MADESRDLFFAVERHRRCVAALERDLAATTPDAKRRQAHLARARRYERLACPPFEALLLS